MEDCQASDVGMACLTLRNRRLRPRFDGHRPCAVGFRFWRTRWATCRIFLPLSPARFGSLRLAYGWPEGLTASRRATTFDPMRAIKRGSSLPRLLTCAPVATLGGERRAAASSLGGSM